jgi:TIGR03009 family protein
LPFVFNLDAARIQQRYWIKLEESPAPNVIMLAAWPKLQEDRAQYKVVQIALNSSFEPIMLRMYAPNFHPKLAPQWDQYEFSSVKRNAIGAGIQKFMGNFIPEQPPANWQITRQNFVPPQIADAQPAGQAAPNRK